MDRQGRLEQLRELPVIYHLRRLLHERRVRRGAAWRFWGVFESRDEAIQRARSLGHTPVGYGTQGLARLGRDVYERMYPFDYPALLWLSRGVQNGGRQVVDLGGHLGVK